MSDNRQIAFLLGGIALVAAGSAMAKEPDIVLPTLTVEGDRVATSAESAIARKRQAPNAITVIEAEQLNQFGDQPLGDALRRLPGVTFPGGNRARDLQLRAIGAEYTQVLVNGRPLIDGSSKRAVQMDRIPSSLVERVEIIRAPLASQDGQGAAGTLNIVLKNGDFTPRTELGLGAGYLDENGTLGDATLLQAGEAGAVRYVLSGGVQRQRRNESKDIFNYGSGNAPNGGELGTNKRAFSQANLTPSIEVQIDPRNMLRFEPTYLYTKEDRDDVANELNADQQSVRRREIEKRERVRENFGLYSAWKSELGIGNLTVSFDAQKATEETARNATRYRADDTVDRRRQRGEDIDLTRYSPAVQMEHVLGNHALTWGGDFSRATREESNSETTNGVVQAPNPVRTYEITENRWNAFVQDSWQVSDTLRLTGGLRLENSRTETEDYLGDTQALSKTFLLPSLHMVYAIQPETDLRIGVARTLRRPDLRELTPTVQTQSGTLGSPDIGGNPNAEPETIWGLDTGIDHYFLGRAGLVSANLFVRQFSDKIEFVSALESGRYVSRPQNTGDGHLYGIELEGRLPLDMLSMPDFTLWGNLTRSRTELDAPTGESRRFLDHHDAVANIGLDWHLAPFRTTFGISANWVSGYEQTARTSDGGAQYTKVDPTTRVDLAARTQLGDGMSLSLSLLNIFASTEERTDKTFDSTGAQTARSETTEDTYRAAYVRVHWIF